MFRHFWHKVVVNFQGSFIGRFPAFQGMFCLFLHIVETSSLPAICCHATFRKFGIKDKAGSMLNKMLSYSSHFYKYVERNYLFI